MSDSGIRVRVMVGGKRNVMMTVNHAMIRAMMLVAQRTRVNARQSSFPDADYPSLSVS